MHKLKFYKGAKIYDDYAHHPSEIAALLSAVEKIKKNRLFILFQPHTYTRTKALLTDFAEVLKKAENLIVTEIYASREKDTLGISSKNLTELIPGSVYVENLEKAEEFLRNNLTENDLFITVGAGDVFKVGERLI